MDDQKQGVIILGSTGSIGKSSLSVIKNNPHLFRVDGLSCLNSIETLAQQIREFSPRIVCTGSGQSHKLREMLGEEFSNLQILEGRDGYKKLASFNDSSKLVAAMVGAAGIEPVMAGIRAGKAIALANKESLVLAGSLLLQEAKKHEAVILPIDSEHNAVFQSLYGEKKKHLEYITLTASGGPFRTRDPDDFDTITLAEALNHPNWSMGKKITIDSATMMNKCLEIIEARWLFDIEPARIRVLIHPQSIVHSMVTFKDASTICQMGDPDMRTPIANCLGFPRRIKSGSEFLDLAAMGTLTFENPDLNKFPTIQMAYDVLALGGGTPAALNGANEVLVDMFLREKIRFVSIFKLLKKIVKRVQNLHTSGDITNYPFLRRTNTIEDALLADQWGRDYIENCIESTTL